MVSSFAIFGLYAMQGPFERGAKMDAFKLFGKEDIEAKKAQSFRLFESHINELIAQKSQEENPTLRAEDVAALLNLFDGIQRDMGTVTLFVNLLLNFYRHASDLISEYRSNVKSTLSSQDRMDEYGAHNDTFEQMGSQFMCFIARCFHAYSRAHLFSPLETMITLSEAVRLRIIYNTVNSISDPDCML